MCQTTTIIRCRRCGVVMSDMELSVPHHYPEHQQREPACATCASDAMQPISDFLATRIIHAPSKAAAEREWVRRVRLHDTYTRYPI